MPKPNTWNLGVEPPPFKMLICAIAAEQLSKHHTYNWLYFIGYYSPKDEGYYCPLTKTKYCSKLVDAWRLFDNNLEHLTMEFDCAETLEQKN